MDMGLQSDVGAITSTKTMVQIDDWSTTTWRSRMAQAISRSLEDDG
jgi:hypothetical protein